MKSKTEEHQRALAFLRYGEDHILFDEGDHLSSEKEWQSAEIFKKDLR